MLNQTETLLLLTATEIEGTYERQPEENQQRRTMLYSGKPTEWNSVFENEIQDSTTSGEIRKFPRQINAPCTMAVRNRAAARAA